MLKDAKRYLTWLLREMRIKIMLKYHFSPIRLAITLKSNTLTGKHVGNKVLSYWWDRELAQVPWKKI